MHLVRRCQQRGTSKDDKLKKKKSRRRRDKKKREREKIKVNVVCLRVISTYILIMMVK